MKNLCGTEIFVQIYKSTAVAQLPELRYYRNGVGSRAFVCRTLSTRGRPGSNLAIIEVRMVLGSPGDGAKRHTRSARIFDA